MIVSTEVMGLDESRAIDAVLINSPLKNYDICPRLNDYTLPVMGLGYIATFANSEGLNVGVLDAEALGLGVSRIAAVVTRYKPTWVGLNLLAPTYNLSVAILQAIDPDILVMLGGHHAKAMPLRILNDPLIPRIDALILGEAEYRAVEILGDIRNRKTLPGVWWRDSQTHDVQVGENTSGRHSRNWLAPDIDDLPLVDRSFFVQDPFVSRTGDICSNMIGSRGCPYDCSFCGAARSANMDIKVRHRGPARVVQEMIRLNDIYSVTSYRFVDDLFLSGRQFESDILRRFEQEIATKGLRWTATGRINTLAKYSRRTLDRLFEAGCREVALGIESGSDRLLKYMGKAMINTDMVRAVVRLLLKCGIGVKGYFIFGYPTETPEEFDESVKMIEEFWRLSDKSAGDFRCSVFEFRPYPGTPEWARLIASGHREEDLLSYHHIDLTRRGTIKEMWSRDEFNYSVNIQFGSVPLDDIRECMTRIMIRQGRRLSFNLKGNIPLGGSPTNILLSRDTPNGESRYL